MICRAEVLPRVSFVSGSPAEAKDADPLTGLGRSLPLSPPSFRHLHLKRVYRFGLPRCNSGDFGMKQFADGI